MHLIISKPTGDNIVKHNTLYVFLWLFHLLWEMCIIFFFSASASLFVNSVGEKWPLKVFAWFINLPVVSSEVSRWLQLWSSVANHLYCMQMGCQGDTWRLCCVPSNLPRREAPRWWLYSISNVLLVQCLSVLCAVSNCALVAGWAQYKSYLMLPVSRHERCLQSDIEEWKYKSFKSSWKCTVVLTSLAFLGSRAAIGRCWLLESLDVDFTVCTCCFLFQTFWSMP